MLCNYYLFCSLNSVLRRAAAEVYEQLGQQYCVLYLTDKWMMYGTVRVMVLVSCGHVKQNMLLALQIR